MNREESFGKLLRRFFSNIDEVGDSNFSSAKIYITSEPREVKSYFLEMIKILKVRLHTPLFFEDELNDLHTQIESIKSQKEVDRVVEVIEDLLPHCQHFRPIYFSPNDLFPGGIRHEIKNFFKAS